MFCLYVDDMLIRGSNDEMIKSTKKVLNFIFDMKDMGLIDVILRIKILRVLSGLIMSQSHYVGKTLEKLSHNDSKLGIAHVDVNLYLSKNIGDNVSHLDELY